MTRFTPTHRGGAPHRVAYPPILLPTVTAIVLIALAALLAG